MDELWSFMQDPAFVADEDALVQLDLDDCRRLNGYYTLRIMAESIASKHLFIESLRSIGIRLTPKDQKGSPERLLRRAEVALLKPHIMQRHLTIQEHALITPDIRKALEEDVPWATFRDTITKIMDIRNADEGKEIIAGTLYALLFLIQDVQLVQRWLARAKEVADPKQTVLSSVLAYSLFAYFRARLRAAETRATQPSENGVQANEIARLRQENQRLREQYEQDVRTLLDVIERLEVKKREGSTQEQVSPLEGKRVLVVGDESHAAEYRTIVQSQGAEFDFLPGFDKDRAIASKLAAADGIVFITAYASHIKFYALKATDKCSVLVSQAGLGAFSKGIEELARKLQEQAGVA
jgi:hypothetical protein